MAATTDTPAFLTIAEFAYETRSSRSHIYRLKRISVEAVP